MKTYTTEQVWRLLEKHPTWTFAAPDSDPWIAMTAFMSVGIEKPCIGYLDRFQCFIGDINRSDWVRTNKPKPIRIDKVKNATSIGVWFDEPTPAGLDCKTQTGSWVSVDPSKTYKVYLVECD